MNQNYDWSEKIFQAVETGNHFDRENCSHHCHSGRVVWGSLWLSWKGAFDLRLFSYFTSPRPPLPPLLHNNCYQLLNCFKIAANICILCILCWALSQIHNLVINMHYSTIFVTTFEVDTTFISILQMRKLKQREFK